MRRVACLVLVGVVLVMAAFCCAPGEPTGVEGFNRYVQEAHARGELWPQDPGGVGTAFVGEGDCEKRSVWFRTLGGNGYVVVTDQGVHDDSLGESQYRLLLRRDDRGHWTIRSASHRWRCQDGRGHPWWSRVPCE